MTLRIKGAMSSNRTLKWAEFLIAKVSNNLHNNYHVRKGCVGAVNDWTANPGY
jgi:hypothetical protein